ncbi:MAG: porin family protein [Chitinophagaceae bacterium]
MKSTWILILLNTVLVTNASMAQSNSATAASPETTFGIRAGVNLQNLNGKGPTGDKLNNSIKTGFHIGANAEIPVATDFYLQPGVLFSIKGANFENQGKLTLSYIEIPVNFLYKPVLGMGKLLLGFGPYAAFAVGGQTNSNNNNGSDVNFESTVTSAQLASGQTYARRFDAGANFLAGYELSNQLSFQLNAQLGLVNINPEVQGSSSDKTSAKNTGFGVSVGYRF